ncbi:MAG: histidine--tRNA ligase [Kiritimatiellae bacterium]|nr:histidine--tRNA ligase [Kiritimatiellia bacterium]
MSEQISFEPPRGMRDFYPEDMAWRNRVFDAFRAAATQAGFEPYDACVVESYALLARKAGEEVGNQIYHFTDKSDRHIALRPEMTPTLARMVAQRQHQLSFPIKWTTIAQCFRYERMTKGRKREHYQWNLDIIGEDSILAEVEVLGTACNALRKMGLKDEDDRVRVSSRALLAELLQASGIEEDKHASIFLALDKRGKIPDEGIKEILRDGGIDDNGIEKAFELLNVKDLDGVAKLVSQDSIALNNLRELFRLAEIAGFAGQLVFDISVIRGLSYYTGIVFECFDTAGEFRAIFGGGRYDNLLTTIGGDPTSAVGLGFGDVVVTELLKSRLGENAALPKNGVFVGFMTPDEKDAALKVAAKLRSNGENVNLCLKKMKPKQFFSRASTSSCLQAIYLGPDDVASGKAKIKNLETREETEFALN